MDTHEKNRSPTAKILLALISTALILSLLLLPFPTRIDQEMYGSIIKEDVQTDEQFLFSVSGWHLNYLLRDDVLKIELRIPGDTVHLMHIKTLGSVREVPSSMYYVSTYSAYSKNTDAMTFGDLFLSADLTDCCLSLEDGMYLVGSTEKSDDPSSLLSRYHLLLN